LTCGENYLFRAMVIRLLYLAISFPFLAIPAGTGGIAAVLILASNLSF
jgi:hypothetical protein